MVFSRIKSGLKKTRENVFSKINTLLLSRNKVDETLLTELEELMLAGDVGVDTTFYILERLRDRLKKDRNPAPELISGWIREEVVSLLDAPSVQKNMAVPYIILVVGVNGTGKTTSIAKLAKYYQQQNKSVLLVAADTFRAAAIEQLSIWAERTGCPIIKHQPNADPAAVVFDALTAAKSRNMDYVIIDTAGRLHTKVNLMTELNKIQRVVERIIPDAPHEVILVLDAGNGQNAINQAQEFVKAVNVSSIFLTKLDGTARGGAVLAIKRQLGIPVKFVGLGEKMEDIAVFNPKEFAEGLFENE